ncbi:unnamed protein product, partial [Didymodactylos carnosus]
VTNNNALSENRRNTTNQNQDNKGDETEFARSGFELDGGNENVTPIATKRTTVSTGGRRDEYDDRPVT